MEEVGGMALEFLKRDKELVVAYSPMYGAEEILNRIKSDDGYSIKHTFWVNATFLREFDEYDEDIICFSIGKYVEGYVEISKEVFGTRHTFFFGENIKFNQRMFVANRNVSILGKIDQVIDNDIYIGGEKQDEKYYMPYEEFTRLIETFPNSTELTKYVHKRIAGIVKEFIPQCDKYEHIYEKYISERELLYTSIGIHDSMSYNKRIKLEQFKIALGELRELLSEGEVCVESMWQQRVHNILQLLYPQYILCDREISFSGVDGNNKRPDFIMVDANGFIDVMEIKKPTVEILSRQPSYRNNYVPSREFSGTVQQIEKYIFCLTVLNREKDVFFRKLQERLPDGILPQVVNPKGILLLGRSENFNEQQTRDFELIRRQYKSIADIMTYDDLVQRFERIIQSLDNELE